MLLKMIDVVYIYGIGSTWQDNELRYSLRSIETHLKDYRNIYLIGKKPGFLNENVIEIPHKDIYHNKARNIMAKCYRAANDERVTKDYLLFNDDYFCLKPFSAKNYPYYYKCDLNHSIAIQHNEYQMHLKATLEQLKTSKLPILNFDVHYPTVYNKKMFKAMCNSYDWDREFGFVVKSMYCNHYGIKGEHRLDCKISSIKPVQEIIRLNENREIFSVGDSCLNSTMRNYIMGLYPNKSKYEK